jgi:hypothetical protein
MEGPMREVRAESIALDETAASVVHFETNQRLSRGDGILHLLNGRRRALVAKSSNIPQVDPFHFKVQPQSFYPRISAFEKCLSLAAC